MSWTEEQYIDALKRKYVETPEIWGMMDQALAAFPRSSKLWCMRGDFVQLSLSESQYSLPDALASYEKAHEVDPNSIEALESIGYYNDVYEDNYPAAEAAFSKAIQLGAGPQSYVGLARVLAQQGNLYAAEFALDSKHCPFHDHPDVIQIRKEIDAGNWNP